MKHTVAVALAFLLVAPAVAFADIDKDKMVGVWEITDTEGIPPGTTVEFTKDGKIKLNTSQGDQKITLEGTYKIEKDKLHYTYKRPDGGERMAVDTIKELTNDRLVLVTEENRTEKYKKRKAEKKEKN